jgi:hypothetical protein
VDVVASVDEACRGERFKGEAEDGLKTPPAVSIQVVVDGFNGSDPFFVAEISVRTNVSLSSTSASLVG